MTTFGVGNRPLLLSRIACTGVESKLIDCSYSTPEAVYCSSSQLAGVTCLPGIILITVVLRTESYKPS